MAADNTIVLLKGISETLNQIKSILLDKSGNKEGNNQTFFQKASTSNFQKDIKDKEKDKNFFSTGADTTKFFNDKESNKNLIDGIGGILSMGSEIKKFSGSLLVFALVPKTVKRNFIDFIYDLVRIGRGFTTKEKESFKLMSEGINIIANSLPVLTKGIFSFGIVTKLGLTQLTVTGLKVLIRGLAALSKPAVEALIVVPILLSVGYALNSIANLFTAVSKIMLNFALGMVATAGAMKLSAMILGTTPLAAAGQVALTMLMTGLTIGLIGTLLTPVSLGITTIALLGHALTSFGVGLLVLSGTLALIKMISGDISVFELIKPVALSIMALGGAVAVVGAISPLVMLGSGAIGMLGLGLIGFSGGLFLSSLATLGIITVTNYDSVFSYAKDMAFSILALGGAVALVGLGSILVLPGTLALAYIGLSMMAFAWTMKTSANILQEVSITDTSKNLVQSVQVVVDGLFDMVKSNWYKIPIVSGGMLLLLPTILTISLFASTLQKFAGVQNSLRPILKQDKDGNVLEWGEPVSIKQLSQNIVDSLMTFVNTLADNKDNIKNAATSGVDAIAEILLGKKGMHQEVRLLGIKLFSGSSNYGEKPSLIEALNGFANVVLSFANNEYYDERGNKKTINYFTAGKNIIDALNGFFSGFNEGSPLLSENAQNAAIKLGEILGGKKATNVKLETVFGFDIFNWTDNSSERPPIIPLIAQFAEIAKVFSSDKPVYFDKDGKVKIDKEMTWNKVGDNIIKALSGFFNGINENTDALTQLSNAAIDKLYKALNGKGNNNQKSMVELLSEFGLTIKAFAESKIPKYDVNGKIIKNSYVNINYSQVGRNIALSMSSFINTLSNGLASSYQSANVLSTNLVAIMYGKSGRLWKRDKEGEWTSDTMMGNVTGYGLFNVIDDFTEDIKNLQELKIDDIKATANNFASGLTSFIDIITKSVVATDAPTSIEVMSKTQETIRTYENFLNNMISKTKGIDDLTKSLEKLREVLGEIKDLEQINISLIEKNNNGVPQTNTTSPSPQQYTGVYGPTLPTNNNNTSQINTNNNNQRLEELQTIAEQIIESFNNKKINVMFNNIDPLEGLLTME